MAYLVESGGVTHITQIAKNGSFTGTAATPMLGWASVGDNLGAAVTESSGVFEFPTTGLWRIELVACTGKTWCTLNLQTCADFTTGPTWGTRLTVYSDSETGEANTALGAFNFQVGDTAEEKVRVTFSAASSCDFYGGGTPPSESRFIFTRMAD